VTPFLLILVLILYVMGALSTWMLDCYMTRDIDTHDLPAVLLFWWLAMPFIVYAALDEIRSENSGCSLPPEGWECLRDAGHDGPCAAVPRRK
jgi:hypothetical protein